MGLELPSGALKDGTVVYQYVQLQPAGAEDGEYISVGCEVTAGEEGSQKVTNYLGLNKMDANAVAGMSVGEQNLGDADEYGEFAAIDGDWNYGVWDYGNGQAYASCAIMLPVPKDETRPEDIFAEFIVTKGARLYKSQADSAPIQIGEKKSKLDLTQVDYDADAIIDTDILELLEESNEWDDDYVETEISLQGSKEATIDAASIFGDSEAVAAQNFFAVYEGNKIIDKPDIVSFVFEADLPKDKIKDATYIYQMVSLTPTSDPTGPAMTIGCVVQVGNPEAVKAYQWEGASDLSFAGTGTVAMADVASSDLVTDSEITARDW